MHIPIRYALISKNGMRVTPSYIEGSGVAGDVIHLRKKKQKLIFGGISERPVPSFLRGFSAPVTLAFEQGFEDRLFLARHDDDLVSRWQALNALATEALISAVNSLRGGHDAKFNPKLISIVGELAASEEFGTGFPGACAYTAERRRHRQGDRAKCRPRCSPQRKKPPGSPSC